MKRLSLVATVLALALVVGCDSDDDEGGADQLSKRDLQRSVATVWERTPGTEATANATNLYFVRVVCDPRGEAGDWRCSIVLDSENVFTAPGRVFRVYEDVDVTVVEDGCWTSEPTMRKPIYPVNLIEGGCYDPETGRTRDYNAPDVAEDRATTTTATVQHQDDFGEDAPPKTECPPGQLPLGTGANAPCVDPSEYD